MISPGRSWEVHVRSWDVLGVHVTSCEYLYDKSWEVLGGPWRPWEVLGEPGRTREVFEVMGGHLSI